MRPNPAKARPKKLKMMASVADVGDDDFQIISENLVGCYAALARGLACMAAFSHLFSTIQTPLSGMMGDVAGAAEDQTASEGPKARLLEVQMEIMVDSVTFRKSNIQDWEMQYESHPPEHWYEDWCHKRMIKFGFLISIIYMFIPSVASHQDDHGRKQMPPAEQEV